MQVIPVWFRGCMCPTTRIFRLTWGYSMAKDEERRHERQAVYGYLGQASASIEHSNNRGGAGATSVENGRDKDNDLVDEEAEAHAERELSNRPWGKEDLAHLQRAVDE